jgi:hypothetical protein
LFENKKISLNELEFLKMSFTRALIALSQTCDHFGLSFWIAEECDQLGFEVRSRLGLRYSERSGWPKLVNALAFGCDHFMRRDDASSV